MQSLNGTRAIAGSCPEGSKKHLHIDFVTGAENLDKGLKMVLNQVKIRYYGQ